MACLSILRALDLIIMIFVFLKILIFHMSNFLPHKYISTVTRHASWDSLLSGRFPQGLLKKLNTDCLVMQNHHVSIILLSFTRYVKEYFYWTYNCACSHSASVCYLVFITIFVRQLFLVTCLKGLFMLVRVMGEMIAILYEGFNIQKMKFCFSTTSSRYSYSFLEGSSPKVQQDCIVGH